MRDGRDDARDRRGGGDIGMLTVSNGEGPRTTGRRRRPRQKKLWHDGARNTGSIGCTACPEARVCGGMNVGKPAFDCLDYCCGGLESCDVVCRRKPGDFVRRVREVGGFALDDVPRSSGVSGRALPPVIPVVYHGGSRCGAFAEPMVSLPLYGFIERGSGGVRFRNMEAVAEKYGIAPGARLLLTGTAQDGPVERWWGLSDRRLEVIRGLRDLGVEMVTTPNFSLFVDRPRWDDLHSMKRIALCHEEFLRKGVRAALHVNARTETDWERWTEYVAARDEVRDIAYEFATGAGRAGRMEWHMRHLSALGREAGRKLHITVRAAPAEVLGRLAQVFDGVTFLDTNAFMKTVKRQRACPCSGGRVRWERGPTAPDESVDALLEHNWDVVRESLTARLARSNGYSGTG